MRLRAEALIPGDLRSRLESARLGLLALFRALDQLHLTPAEIPQKLLRQLFELDADYAEALWALDQPVGALDIHVMVQDTEAALQQLSQARVRFRQRLPARTQPRIEILEAEIRNRLPLQYAYLMIPGRDPQNG